MIIVEKKIDELKVYEGNPRLNDDAVAPVAESIKSFGFKVPLVIDEHDTIVCGHTRYQAAVKLGLESVPCVVAADLNEDEVRAFRVVENRTSEYATWNLEKLVAEMKITDYNFDVWQLPSLLPQEIPTLPDTPDTPKGIDYKPKYGVVIDCSSEQDQKVVYESVIAFGYSARIVSI